MKLALRLGLIGLAVVAFATTVVSPQAPGVAASSTPQDGATQVWSQPTAATNSVMVKYRGAPEGAQAGPISAQRLAQLRTVASRLGVTVDYSRTMGIGAYVMTLGRSVSGIELDAVVLALQSSDPAIEWVVPDGELTFASEVLTSDDQLPFQWNLKDGPGGIRALDAWDEQWQFAASEGKPGYVPDNGTGSRLVRYGQYNGSWVYKEISGDFTCSPSTFGSDPDPGIAKRCEVASYWVKAADEGESIILAHGVSKWVRYGWGDNWRYATVTDHGVCSPTQFGGDPAKFVKKICQVELRTDGGGVVANEGDTFTLQRPATVRYGVMAKWTYTQVPARVQATCGRVYFAADPAPGYVKHCEVVKSMGFGVTIAIPDRGSVWHPDLKNKLVPGYNFVDRNTDTSDLGSGSAACGNKPDGFNWHGLEVASVAGAETNNGIGIAGVAPMANILMEKVATCSSNSVADMLDAMTWAVGGGVPNVPPNLNPARVVNLSMTLGTPGAPCSAAWQAAIDKVRERGGVVVAAAGNGSADLAKVALAPTNCTNVIVVAGTDSTGKRWPASNYGTSVTLSAPGASMRMLSDEGAVLPGSAVVIEASGTSFAAPHVSGVAALMFGKNPKLTPSNVEDRLFMSAQRFRSPCPGCGHGIVDAVTALRSAEAISHESEPNNYDEGANYISAPADVIGQFDTVGKADVYSVDLLPGETLNARVFTEAPGATCEVQYGVYPYYLECSVLEQGYQNSTAKTQRLFVHIGTNTNTSTGREYTLLAWWTQPR